jgi:hypothetical protein
MSIRRELSSEISASLKGAAELTTHLHEATGLTRAAREPRYFISMDAGRKDFLTVTIEENDGARHAVNIDLRDGRHLRGQLAAEELAFLNEAARRLASDGPQAASLEDAVSRAQRPVVSVATLQILRSEQHPRVVGEEIPTLKDVLGRMSDLSDDFRSVIGWRDNHEGTRYYHVTDGEGGKADVFFVHCIQERGISVTFGEMIDAAVTRDVAEMIFDDADLDAAGRDKKRSQLTQEVARMLSEVNRGMIDQEGRHFHLGDGMPLQISIVYTQRSSREPAVHFYVGYPDEVETSFTASPFQPYLHVMNVTEPDPKMPDGVRELPNKLIALGVEHAALIGAVFVRLEEKAKIILERLRADARE